MSDLLDQQYKRNERARQKNKQEERRMVHDIESKKGMRALHEYRVEMVNREQKKIAKELERIRAGLRSHRQRLVVTDQEKEWKRDSSHPLATARSEKSPLGKQSLHRTSNKTKSPFSRNRPQGQLDPFVAKKLPSHQADRRPSKALSPKKRNNGNDDSDSDDSGDSDEYSDDEDHSDDDDPNVLPSPEILKAILKGVVSCWEETVAGPAAAAVRNTETTFKDGGDQLTLPGLMESPGILSTNPRPSRTPRNSIIPDHKRVNPKDLRGMKNTPRPSNAGLTSNNLHKDSPGVKVRHNSIPSLMDHLAGRSKNDNPKSYQSSITSLNSASKSLPSAGIGSKNIGQIDMTPSTNNNENPLTKETSNKLDGIPNDDRLLLNGSHKTNHINDHSVLETRDSNSEALGKESSGVVEYDNKTRRTTHQLPLIEVTDTGRREKGMTHETNMALNSSGEKIYTSERQGIQFPLTGSTTSESVNTKVNTPIRYPRSNNQEIRLPDIGESGDIGTNSTDENIDAIFKHNNKVSALITSSKSLNSTPREDLDNVNSRHKSKAKKSSSSLSLTSTPRPSRPFNKDGDKVNDNVALPSRTNSAWTREDKIVNDESKDRNDIDRHVSDLRDTTNTSPGGSVLDEAALYKNPKLHVFQGSANRSAGTKASGNSPHEL